MRAGQDEVEKAGLSSGAETPDLRHKQLLSSSPGQSQIFALGLKAPCFWRTAARELDYNDNDDDDEGRGGGGCYLTPV